MKKYNVYGVGNALVDTEYEVEDQFLSNLNIEKGVMTLIEADTQTEMLAELNARYSAKKHTGGGSAANTLVALAQFGGKAYYTCKVANDAIGKIFLEDLQAAGILTNPASHQDAGTTGQCLVMISADAERTMNTHLGISQQLSCDELDLDALQASEYLYIEGYLISSPTALEAAHMARDSARSSGIPVAITLSDPAMVSFFRDQLETLLEGGVDLLFCNQEEALIYTGRDQVEQAATDMMDVAGKFAITLGAEGSLIFDGDTLFQVPARPARAIDTNGAGDMFAGAFLYAITHGFDYAKAAKLANESASQLITQFGARLDAASQTKLLQSIN